MIKPNEDVFIYAKAHDILSIYTDKKMKLCKDDILSLPFINTVLNKDISTEIFIKPEYLYRFFLYGESIFSIIESYTEDSAATYVASRNNTSPLMSYKAYSPFNRHTLLNVVRRIQVSVDLRILSTLLSCKNKLLVYSDPNNLYYGASYSTKIQAYEGENVDGYILTSIKNDLKGGVSTLCPKFIREEDWKFDKIFQENLRFIQSPDA